MTEQETRPIDVAEQEPIVEQKNNDDNSVRTVFHDAKNYNVKHPLQNTWTLWFDNPGKKANAASWSQNLKEIVNVDTVEDFWGYLLDNCVYNNVCANNISVSVHNNIVKVNHLEISSNYHVFKKGIRPEWEDAANANGGKFSIQFPRNRTGESINDYWLNLVI